MDNVVFPFANIRRRHVLGIPLAMIHCAAWEVGLQAESVAIRHDIEVWLCCQIARPGLVRLLDVLVRPPYSGSIFDHEIMRSNLKVTYNQDSVPLGRH